MQIGAPRGPQRERRPGATMTCNVLNFWTSAALIPIGLAYLVVVLWLGFWRSVDQAKSAVVLGALPRGPALHRDQPQLLVNVRRSATSVGLVRYRLRKMARRGRSPHSGEKSTGPMTVRTKLVIVLVGIAVVATPLILTTDLSPFAILAALAVAGLAIYGYWPSKW